MLYREKVIAALEEKRHRFQEAERSVGAALERMGRALSHFEGLSLEEIEELTVEITAPGARPTLEQDTQPLVVPFGERWSNHREAREWALDILPGITTCAADGSQIPGSRDLSIPVGVVQVGWFQNHHSPGGQGRYVKDVHVEVLSPDELGGSRGTAANQEIEWRRFDAEIRQAERFMREQEGASAALVFFDGSLIVSFVSSMTPARQREYVLAVEQLLNTSEETRVPLVGYVDASRAIDLGSLVALCGGVQQKDVVSDGALLRSRITGWGDRSRLYHCARDDQVLPINGYKYYDRVLFTYLQTTASNRPARIEMPHWIFQEGQHEWVLDVIRAECVVGLGYPYTLESADAAAVLTMQDREHFLAIFQQFAEESELPLEFSRKATSKKIRRV